MTRHAIRNTALLMLVAALCSGASCVSDGDSGGYGGNTRRQDDRYDDYSDSDGRPRRIPTNADVVKEGGGKLRWRADLDGTVFVYDQSSDIVRYAGRVTRGATVQVMPDDDRVTVDGASVSTENLAKNAYHQLYFTSGRRADYDSRTPYDSNDRNARRTDRPAKPPVNGVPAGADKLARGSGTLELAAAPANGTVYVFDEDAGDVIYRANLRRGSAFKVVPGERRVYVDGDLKDRPKFAKGHTLTLYFSGR